MLTVLIPDVVREIASARHGCGDYVHRLLLMTCHEMAEILPRRAPYGDALCVSVAEPHEQSESLGMRWVMYIGGHRPDLVHELITRVDKGVASIDAWTRIAATVFDTRLPVRVNFLHLLLGAIIYGNVPTLDALVAHARFAESTDIGYFIIECASRAAQWPVFEYAYARFIKRTISSDLQFGSGDVTIFDWASCAALVDTRVADAIVDYYVRDMGRSITMAHLQLAYKYRRGTAAWVAHLVRDQPVRMIISTGRSLAPWCLHDPDLRDALGYDHDAVVAGIPAQLTREIIGDALRFGDLKVLESLSGTPAFRHALETLDAEHVWEYILPTVAMFEYYVTVARHWPWPSATYDLSPPPTQRLLLRTVGDPAAFAWLWRRLSGCEHVVLDLAHRAIREPDFELFVLLYEHARAVLLDQVRHRVKNPYRPAERYLTDTHCRIVYFLEDREPQLAARYANTWAKRGCWQPCITKN